MTAPTATNPQHKSLAYREISRWTEIESAGFLRKEDYVPFDMNKLDTNVMRGRPREFCVHDALAKALRIFWTKGYEGTSLNDLTEAMGITRPSLYAAFGNKESLFRKALDLYEREKLEYIGRALDQPTARGVAEVLLRGAVDNASSSDEPHGCLGVITSVACGEEARSIRNDVLERGKIAKRALIDRLERAKKEGDLPPHIEVESLTNLLYAIVQGVCIQAGSGATRDELNRLVDTGLAMWPSA
jgi:AcrR family transcriptional regulator